MITSYLIGRDTITGQLAVIRPVNDDGTYGSPVDVNDAAFRAWNSAQATPDDLLPHPIQPTPVPQNIQNAIVQLKQYQGLSGQGTPAQMDAALKAQIVVDRYLFQALLS